MDGKYAAFINEKIAIRQLRTSDIDDLLNAGFPYKFVLHQVLSNRIRKIVGLMQRAKGLVAYNVKENQILGYLSLVEHTSSIYSIAFLFTVPNFRKLGVASGLLNYAMSLARERGAKKVYLTADSRDDASLMEFYANRGFGLVIDNSILWGGGSTAKLQAETENRLTSVNVISKGGEDYLFSVYNKIMGQNWIDFFNITKNKLINGFSQHYRQFFFSKYAFVNESVDLLVLVYKIPLVSNGFVEIYAGSDSFIPPILGDLSQILHDKGIKYIKISAFNLTGNEFFGFLTKMDFYPYQAQILGRCL